MSGPAGLFEDWWRWTDVYLLCSGGKFPKFCTGSHSSNFEPSRFAHRVGARKVARSRSD